MEEVKNESLSITDAFQSGLADESLSSDETSDDNDTEDSSEAPDGSEEVKKEEEIKSESDDDKKEVEGEKPDANNKVKSDEVKGEYTKERFDGLMSAWQKDRDALSKVAEQNKTLEERLSKLETTVSKPDNNTEDEFATLPPDVKSALEGADEETKAGFRMLLKAQDGKLSQVEERIVGKIMETLNAPLKERNANKAKVDKEVEQLSVELGDEFKQNITAITKFAADNEYPLGTLKQAFGAWKVQQELAKHQGKLDKGKKVLTEAEQELQKRGELPKGSANRSGEMPVFDPERDGNKDLSDIFSDVKKYI
jgi:uncharacterized protein (DUF3084 family)